MVTSGSKFQNTSKDHVSQVAFLPSVTHFLVLVLRRFWGNFVTSLLYKREMRKKRMAERGMGGKLRGQKEGKRQSRDRFSHHDASAIHKRDGRNSVFYYMFYFTPPFVLRWFIEAACFCPPFCQGRFGFFSLWPHNGLLLRTLFLDRKLVVIFLEHSHVHSSP